MPPPRIYLDNAATSFPKPEGVYAAMDRYHRELGTAVGRGSGRAALEVQRVVDRCRARAARLFGVAKPEQVIFAGNGTDALNLALHGLLRAGDRVVSTVWEHNSVLRPLADLNSRLQVTTEFVGPGGGQLVDVDRFAAALKTPTRLVVLTHASNVTGEILPVAELAALARAAGSLVLVDAAQTAGHFRFTLDDLGADLIAMPGHKGLLGPLGTGLLLLRTGIERELRPVRQGGTGTASESPQQPAALPDRYESGNHNAPGLFGLESALAWREEQPKNAGDRESQWMAKFSAGLRELPGVTIHRALDSSPTVGLASLSLDRLPPQILANLLEEHFGIETRAGLHCAPNAHAQLGTLEQGGTVRFSCGPFNTDEHLDESLRALAEIAASV